MGLKGGAEMQTSIMTAVLCTVHVSFAPPYAFDRGGAAPITVTLIRSSTLTSIGWPNTLPQKNVEVAASIYGIAP